MIAYHLRQAFKPGEVTPEEANQIGRELALKLTKGNHAFVVCTHVDKHHVHNHIIINSTTLDCQKKFRNFWGSTWAIRRMNDKLCLEHGLSIVENPKPSRDHYGTRKTSCTSLSVKEVILGHASVSFTMDTYTHVLNNHKVESMALMGELFDMGQVPQQEISYPVIATPLVNGEYGFSAPNFPEVNFSGPDLYQGLQYMKEHLQEELLVSICPPEPTPANQIMLDAGQLLLQIPV